MAGSIKKGLNNAKWRQDRGERRRKKKVIKGVKDKRESRKLRKEKMNQRGKIESE